MSEDTYGSIGDLRSNLRLCKECARTVKNEYESYSIFDVSRRKGSLKRYKIFTVQIDSLYQKSNECSEYSKEEFVPFIISLLEYKEHDNYSFVDSIYDRKTKTSYDIITTTTHVNEIYENYSEFNLISFCTNCNDNKFIILKHDDKYGLHHNLKFRDEYANYPYLESVGEDIINYRLKNEDVTSKEALDNVLNNLKNKKKKKLVV